MDLSIRSATSATRTPSATASRVDEPAAPAVREAAADTWRAAETASGIAAVATPKPLRFPWLSRLSEQLDAAAGQKPAFPSAQVLGDHLDRSV